MTTMHSRYQNASRQRGFTLIELLIVIGIIAVLSSIILVSLNKARGKGDDAAIKANLATFSAQVEFYFHEHGYYAFGEGGGNNYTYPYTYGGNSASLFDDKTAVSALNAAAAASPNPQNTHMSMHENAYAAIVERPASDNSSIYWCVDSEGTKCGTDTYDIDNLDSNSVSSPACNACTVYK